MTNQAQEAVASAFASLDEELKLDPAERAQAQQRHNEVRDCLNEAGLTTASFLQGSFARATMLKPLKDVDTVNMVAPAWREVAEATGGVQNMFNQFKAAVSAEWPTANFDVEKQARKALAVTFTDCRFTVDLCAALPTGNDDVVLLGNRDPDADEQWQPSLTRKLNRLIAARNQTTGKVFVHQVRAMKTLKHLHADLKDVPGLVFEAAAYWSISAKLPFAEALAVALRAGAGLLPGRLPDPAQENDLTAEWAPNYRATVVWAFEKLADRAEAAVGAAERDNLTEAMEHWRAVVGSDFGTDAGGAEGALANWSVGGRETSRWGAEHGDRLLEPSPGRSWLDR